MVQSTRAKALWYVAPGQIEIREQVLPALKPGWAQVRSLFSAISRGTERLIFNGQVCGSVADLMRAPFQEGEFPFPVKYGYCMVGLVEEGPQAFIGRRVFCLHPHQDRFQVPVQALVPVPDEVPSERAVLAANMETALNALWDSRAGPGDDIVVIGAGIVGLLTAWLCTSLAGSRVTLSDIDGEKAGLAHKLGCGFARPGQEPEGADIVFHASASEAGLAQALSCAGLEGTIVEMSWYGSRKVSIPLDAFHARRLKIISSQVGLVSSARRSRWTHQRRLEKALDLLKAPVPGLPAASHILFEEGQSVLQSALCSQEPLILIHYPQK